MKKFLILLPTCASGASRSLTESQILFCPRAMQRSVYRIIKWGKQQFWLQQFFIFSYSVDFECEGKAPFCAVWMWHRKIAFYKKTENFWTFTKTDRVNMIMETEAHLYDFSRYLRKRQSETNLITTLRADKIVNLSPVFTVAFDK